MFRDKPILFVLCVLLIAAYGAGILILLIWWLTTLGTTLTVTDERSTLRKGILSKNTSDVYHTDVRNVQISQGLLNRIFGVGAIGISSSGQDDVEIAVGGLPNPQQIKEIIDQHRRRD